MISRTCFIARLLGAGKSIGLVLLLYGLAIVAPPARAVDVILPDGKAVNLDTQPQLKRRLQSSLDSWANPGGRPGDMNVVFSSPTFCPISLSSTSIATPTEKAAEHRCTEAALQRLVDYDGATRQRCTCIKVATSSAPGQVRILDPLVLDPFSYFTMTLLVTKGSTREKLRGFIASSREEFRVHNANRQLVCSTKRADSSGIPGDLDCFGGRSRAVGTYQQILDKTISGYAYGIGRYRTADGTQLDFVANLADSELVQRYPSFPETGYAAAPEPLSTCNQRIPYSVSSTSAAAPPSVQAFLGTWTGNWGDLCSALVVEAFNADGSLNILYVWGKNEIVRTAGFARYRATISGDTLSFDYPGAAQFVFKRTGNSLEASRRTSDRFDLGRFTR